MSEQILNLASSDGTPKNRLEAERTVPEGEEIEECDGKCSRDTFLSSTIALLSAVDSLLEHVCFFQEFFQKTCEAHTMEGTEMLKNLKAKLNQSLRASLNGLDTLSVAEKRPLKKNIESHEASLDQCYTRVKSIEGKVKDLENGFSEWHEMKREATATSMNADEGHHDTLDKINATFQSVKIVNNLMTITQTVKHSDLLALKRQFGEADSESLDLIALTSRLQQDSMRIQQDSVRIQQLEDQLKQFKLSKRDDPGVSVQAQNPHHVEYVPGHSTQSSDPHNHESATRGVEQSEDLKFPKEEKPTLQSIQDFFARYKEPFLQQMATRSHGKVLASKSIIPNALEKQISDAGDEQAGNLILYEHMACQGTYTSSVELCKQVMMSDRAFGRMWDLGATMTKTLKDHKKILTNAS